MVISRRSIPAKNSLQSFFEQPFSMYAQCRKPGVIQKAKHEPGRDSALPETLREVKHISTNHLNEERANRTQCNQGDGIKGQEARAGVRGIP